MTTDVLRSLTYETAREYIGQTFQIRFDDGTTVDLKLDRVVLVMEKHLSPRMKRDAFSMQFLGPRNVQLPQSMYPTYHEALGGPFPLFIVPVGVEEGGIVYEAVFN
jgi:hypothetical protein